jgi:hypothetical protein
MKKLLLDAVNPVFPIHSKVVVSAIIDKTGDKSLVGQSGEVTESPNERPVGGLHTVVFPNGTKEYFYGSELSKIN